MKVTESEYFELKKNLKDFGQVKILTGSMAPLIGVNDIVQVQRIDPNEIKPYDIIVFWQEDKLVCHFFIRKEDNKLIARGLNNKEHDNKIEEKYVLAKVIKPRVAPFKKFLLKYLLR